MSRRTIAFKIVSEAYGKAGVYAACFIDQALNQGGFERGVEKADIRSWGMSGIPAQKTRLASKRITGKSGREYKLKTVAETIYMDGSDPSYERHRSKPPNELILDTADALQELRQSLFPENMEEGEPRFQMRLQGDPSEQFRQCADPAFAAEAKAHYEGAGMFIKDPSIIIQEAAISMKQVCRWICMDCETPGQALIQMEALFEPSVPDPRDQERLMTPLELLGLGNNSDIARFIDDERPSLINGRPIVRKTWENGEALFDPEFVEMWLDKDLQIGGCPAMAARRRIGEVYMDFGRMFVECAKRLKAHKDALTYGEADCRSDPAINDMVLVA